MFDNIGSKLKTLAKVLCWIGIVLSVVAAIVMFTAASYSNSGESYVVMGLITLIVGPLLSWVNSFVLYGFGELIDKTSSIERSVRDNSKSDTYVKDYSERIAKLNNLRSKNLITEDEYQKALEKEKI